MKVAPGKFVEYAYTLYNDADGSILFQAPEQKPDMLVFGASQEVVPGLLAAIDGLSAGDKFSITLPPEAAFGLRNEEDVVELDRQIFMRDGELAEEVKVGAVLPMMTAEGYRVVGTVLEIGPEKVKMDFNHPFAGLTVRFDGKVLLVRDATEDEIHPATGCGGGCGGCGGGCGDANDGDSCCSTGKGCCGSC